MAKRVSPPLDITQQPLSTNVKGLIVAIGEACSGHDTDFPILLHRLMHQVAKEQRDADTSELTSGQLQKPLVIIAPPAVKSTPAPAQKAATPETATQ